MMHVEDLEVALGEEFVDGPLNAGVARIVVVEDNQAFRTQERHVLIDIPFYGTIFMVAVEVQDVSTGSDQSQVRESARIKVTESLKR